MNIRAETTNETKRDFPVEIYIAMVDALYADVRTFLFGALTAWVAALYAAYLTSDVVLDVFAVALGLVSLGRTIHIMSYRRARADVVTYEAAHRWERAYTVGANAYVFLLGLWCFASFALTTSVVAQLFSMSLVLAHMVGVTGRNFANGRFVDTQIVLLAIPVIAGLVVAGNIDHIVLALFFAPFFVSTRSVAARLRNILLDAVIAKRDVELLAARFDTALNNMPHGLAMFDATGRLVVVNARWGEMLHCDPESIRSGARIEAIVASYAESGVINPHDASRIMEMIRRRAGDRLMNRLEVETSERHIDVAFQPMENGGLVVVIEDITEKRRTEARMTHMARHDALTGLPNRIQFQERLELALTMRSDSDVLAVLFVDLDNFKQVNDTLGHPIGDTLLIEVADRLRFVVGETNVVARFGADEFVVLQSGVRTVNEVAKLAGRIIENLSDMFQIEGSTVVCGASVGIALAPRDGTDPDQLLKSADMALARAKAGGKGILHFYEEEMDRQAQARRATELDLRKAIHNEQLAVYFQPLLNLKTLRITTCEALVRWPHPTRGMVSPAEFIPIAEETGLVVELGRQVLRKACAACAAWPNEVRVAVNLSSVQFDRDDVVALVRDTLQATGLAADRLELEITETLLLQDSASILATLETLREMGVRIALDDFGTGYSSLSYLQKFPLQKVKIDRSFVRNLETDLRSVKLLQGVTRLGADLGLAVVVEGVETYAQMKLIDEPGVVTEIQGFLLSPAIPDDQLRILLSRSGAGLLKKVA
ncbi:putative bifunctional diguanylate cyclase/phosphodiesterase [Phreatobacter stygius]|uniref:EAL domain-containing protein n=1 Tax=Phreatobacter stygius TaxID=1940610 RepID=A0A4D7B0D6_9HYPH|nr:EAL domain-containing protein [Phreatobacter stygius]QCI63480.1 EAL domain-containing protein [Phreatobacter stygius]